MAKMEGLEDAMNNSNGPDIVAYINGKKAAIEYETGRKSAASTAKMLTSRSGSFASTIVLVNSKAYGFYKSYFESEKTRVLDTAELDGIPAFFTDKDLKLPLESLL